MVVSGGSRAGPGPPLYLYQKRTGTGCCFAFSFVVVVLFHMFYTLFLNSFCIQHKSLKNCLPARNNKISKTVKKALSYLVTCTSVALQTHRKTNIKVPFPRCIQAFLLIAINLWILVSIEFTMNVSGTHSFSVASPLRIMVWLRPKPSRGSCQNCPMYKSTENS